MTKELDDLVKEFENKNTEEFSRLLDLESKLVEDVLGLLKENDIKKLGTKIKENQDFE